MEQAPFVQRRPGIRPSAIAVVRQSRSGLSPAVEGSRNGERDANHLCKTAKVPCNPSNRKKRRYRIFNAIRAQASASASA